MSKTVGCAVSIPLAIQTPSPGAAAERVRLGVGTTPCSPCSQSFDLLLLLVLLRGVMGHFRLLMRAE